MMGSKADKVQHKKLNLLRRFIQKTKRVFRPKISPSSATTSQPTAITSSQPPQLRELTFQSSSSINQDPTLVFAEWLSATSDPIHALGTWHAEIFTDQTCVSNETPTSADGTSSVYSQLDIDHVDSASPTQELLDSSSEAVGEEPSIISCHIQAELCQVNARNVDQIEPSSFEEARQLSVLDIVRRTFSNANLRFLPSTDSTLEKLDLLGRLEDLPGFSSTSIGSSQSSGVAFRTTARTATSLGLTTTDDCLRAHEEDSHGAHGVHTRGQYSVDDATRSFFIAAHADNLQHHIDMPLPFLTEDVEDISISLADLFTLEEYYLSIDGRGSLKSAENQTDPNPRYSFYAQSLQDIELIRGQRLLFAARLEAELGQQKEVMEAEFENCYATSDKLHEIDLLNLKEDHEAEVQDLQEERDAAISELQEVAARKGALENDVRTLNALNVNLEKILMERCEEAESFRCQAKAFSEQNRLPSENEEHWGLTQGYNACCQEKDKLVAHLKHITVEKNALQIQNADLTRCNNDLCAAYDGLQKERELGKRQLEAIVEEKANDYAWHMEENRNPMILKSEDPEQAEAKATAMARELYRRETVKVLSLRNKLDEVRLTTDAELRRKALLVDEVSEELRVTAVVLDASLDENQQLGKKVCSLLMAMKGDGSFSETQQGLAGDLQTAFEERALFALAFSKAEIEIARGERRRRLQVCDLRDLLEEKDKDLERANERLHQADDKASAQEYLLAIKDDEIHNIVPELKERIQELENIMEGQAMFNNRYQAQVIRDLQNRLGRQERIAKWYEHEFTKSILQIEGLKSDWGFYVGGTERDLQLARNSRDERDVLKVECLAMRERFADDLFREPLVVPETLKTTKEIEEEQLSHPGKRVIKQFVDTYKAIPKWMVEPGCPGYEVLRMEHMEGRFDRERETIEKLSSAEDQAQGDEDLASLLLKQEEDSFC